MAEQLPIACTLTADELPERLGEMRAIGRDALIAAGERGLRFRADPGVRERLEALAAAEAECCAFMTLAVTEENGELVLSIDAPPDAEPVVHELVAAFAND